MRLIFAGLDSGQRIADLGKFAVVFEDLSQTPGCRSNHRHGRLLGFNLDEFLVLLHVVTDAFFP